MIVLDTHVLVWWVNGDDRLSAAARTAIDGEQKADDGQICVSAISAWEVAMLVRKDRLALAMDVDDWLDAVAELDHVSIAPLSRRVLVQSTRLPGDFHADPADRMIVAFARENNAVLVTADGRIHRYAHVRWVW